MFIAVPFDVGRRYFPFWKGYLVYPTMQRDLIDIQTPWHCIIKLIVVKAESPVKRSKQVMQPIPIISTQAMLNRVLQVFDESRTIMAACK